MPPPITTDDIKPVWGPSDLPVDHLVIEDETPVDAILAERQHHLLVETLYASWQGPGPGRDFLALTNVGLFYAPKDPPIVPDVMVTLDRRPAADMSEKKNRSYFLWVVGKQPDVVVEVVSNNEGGEDDHKLRVYAQLDIRYYVIHDPLEYLGEVLRIMELKDGTYELLEGNWLAGVNLGLTLWPGTYEGVTATWLRWCDADGKILPTGAERADRLADKLRSLGIDPNA